MFDGTIHLAAVFALVTCGLSLCTMHSFVSGLHGHIYLPPTCCICLCLSALQIVFFITLVHYFAACQRSLIIRVHLSALQILFYYIGAIAGCQRSLICY